MKKRVFSFLIAGVLAWSGIWMSAQAGVFEEAVEELNDKNDSTEEGIAIQFEEPAASDRYRVEIEWGEMEFLYQPAGQVWDTEQLKWTEQNEGEKGIWKQKDGTVIKDGVAKIHVALKNYSSHAVAAKFLSGDKDFTNNPVTLNNGTVLELAEGNPRVERAKENENPKKSGKPTVGKFILALSGDPEVPVDEEFATTIPVTCIVRPAEE